MTSILAAYMNYKDIEVIKSWKPFIDIFNARINEKEIDKKKKTEKNKR